jgi:hypothetical protein
MNLFAHYCLLPGHSINNCGTVFLTFKMLLKDKVKGKGFSENTLGRALVIFFETKRVIVI